MIKRIVFFWERVNKMENETIIILNQLKEVFPINKLKWRIISVFEKEGRGLSGIVAPYIDSRELMNRLDNVLGGKWACNYNLINCNGLLAVECTISITTNEGIISRSDIADVDVNSSFGSSSILKSGYSNSFKRAAVAWGLGRYLYSLDNYFVPIESNNNGDFKINGRFKINGAEKFVKGSFNAPTNKLLNDLNSNGYDTTSLVQNSNSKNSYKQTTNTEDNQVDEKLSKIRNDVAELVQILGFNVNTLNPIIQNLNKNEQNLSSTSLTTASRLYKNLNSVKTFFDISFSRGLNLDDIYTIVRTVLKRNVNSPADMLVDFEDDLIRVELKKRIDSFNKIA